MTNAKNPVVLDEERLDELVTGISEGSLPVPGGWRTLVEFINNAMDKSYFAGREEVLTNGEARTAMLEAVARWRDAADDAKDALGKMVGEFVAKAFEEEARQLKGKHRSEVTEIPLPELYERGLNLEDFVDAPRPEASDDGNKSH